MSHLMAKNYADLGSLGACVENKPTLKLGVRRAAFLHQLL